MGAGRHLDYIRHAPRETAAALYSVAMLKEDRGTVDSAGATIFYRAWTPPEVSRRGVLVIPGIGLHGEPYRVVAEHLAPGGHRVIAVDLRGHGHSSGPRGRVPAPGEVIADLDAVVRRVRDAYGLTHLHLLGESMGSVAALTYAAARSAELASVVLVASAVRLAFQQVLKPENLALLPALAFAWDRPVIDVAGRRLDEASADAAFRAARRADPLAINVLSPRYLLTLDRLRRPWAANAAAITARTLLLHGKRDPIVDWRGSRELHAALAARDRKLALFPHARHTLFWDPATPEVFRTIGGWLATA
jgi:alpha-beta hydrolase superfamily lysophospholipase